MFHQKICLAVLLALKNPVENIPVLFRCQEFI